MARGRPPKTALQYPHGLRDQASLAKTRLRYHFVSTLITRMVIAGKDRGLVSPHARSAEV